MEWFTTELLRIADIIQKVSLLEEIKKIRLHFVFLQDIEINLNMIFTSLDSEKCNTTTHCFVCENPLIEGEKLVRDHNHYTGWKIIKTIYNCCF